jgi:hypothetical protein
MAAAQVDDGLCQRVVGLNRLGGGLEVTLCGDQIHQFLREVDVGSFTGTSPQGTETS